MVDISVQSYCNCVDRINKKDFCTNNRASSVSWWRNI